MTEQVELIESKPGSWTLVGALSVLSLSDDWRRLDKRRPLEGDWSIDCAQLSKIDSAGIAYLISCLRHAAAKNLTLAIENLPADAHGLMKAQGVSSFF